MALRKRLAQQGSSLMLTIVLGVLSLTMAALITLASAAPAKWWRSPTLMARALRERRYP